MKQNYSKDLARKICEELGIEWDKTATAPALRGIEITSESIQALFPETFTWKRPHQSYSYRMENSAKKSAMIIGYSEAGAVYEHTDRAPLAA